MIEESIKDYQDWFNAIIKTKKVLKQLEPDGNVHLKNYLDDFINELQSDRQFLMNQIGHSLQDDNLTEEQRRILEEIVFEVDTYQI